MMNTTTLLHERTVGEIAAEHPLAIRIFEAWKIDYCCGGATPLRDACARAGKTPEEFAAALDAAAVVPTTPRDWSHEPLTVLARYVVESYHRYTREELATMQPLAAKVFGVHGERRTELRDVVALVDDLVHDMLPHMFKEEEILFPYVERLEQATRNGAPVPIPFFGTVRNPIRMMMLEHDRVAEILERLRIVTEDYSAPASACFSYRELYRRLSEFELRTHEHVHIENNIYFPRAVELEDRSGQSGDCGPGSGSSCD
jgi:regulator of cell morphogenesis and NO signaling